MNVTKVQMLQADNIELLKRGWHNYKSKVLLACDTFISL